MRLVHTYRMTIASTWYDKAARGAKEYELHFTAARRGKIRTIRRGLAKRGARYFQGIVYRRTRRWIPKWKVKVRFEREEPATKAESTVRIDGRSMVFRGRRWSAYPLGKRELSYARRKRNHKRS